LYPDFQSSCAWKIARSAGSLYVVFGLDVDLIILSSNPGVNPQAPEGNDLEM
jgi:hypothetical protein